MKKSIIVVLAAALVVSLAACQAKESKPNGGDDSGNSSIGSETNVSEGESASRELSESKARDSISRILKEIQNFRYTIMCEKTWGQALPEVGDSATVVFDTYNATRAACLYVANGANGNTTPIGDDYEGYYIDEASINTPCKNMFGIAPDIKSLKNNPEEVYASDVILINERPMFVYTIYDTELASETVNTTVNPEKDGYSAVQEIFHGYWGIWDMEGAPNFEITYDFEEDSASDYGLVLKKMTIKRTVSDEELFNRLASSSGDGLPTSFYGIWCYGSKDQADADSFCDALLAKGFDAKVLLSSDWSNLNQDPYYVVTAGLYSTEDEANAAISSVKSAGYSDAYVKYSGERK